MEKIIIGVDPHKLSATIEVVDHHEKVLASGRFSTDKAGYSAMRKQVASWPERVWAVEGSNGCWPTVNTSSTSLRSSQPGRGCSIPDTAARPTPMTRTQWPLPRSAPRSYGCWPSIQSWGRCGCWSIGARSWRGSEPRPPTGSNACWVNSPPARRRRTSPPVRPRQSWPASVRATRSGRPAVVSRPNNWPTW